MALPGGRAAASDPSPAATAARETREEVGIDVEVRGRLLGPLDAVLPQSARAPSIAVHPFVFAVAADAEAHPDPREVREAIWVRVDELLEPGAAVEYLHEMHDGTTMRFPAFGARGNVVWGLTHHILTGFLALYAQAMDALSLEDGRPGSGWR
jgi:ADP-ribose pyrophosphatase YjhB (NUDIX family)